MSVCMLMFFFFFGGGCFVHVKMYLGTDGIYKAPLRGALNFYRFLCQISRNIVFSPFLVSLNKLKGLWCLFIYVSCFHIMATASNSLANIDTNNPITRTSATPNIIETPQSGIKFTVWTDSYSPPNQDTDKKVACNPKSTAISHICRGLCLWSISLAYGWLWSWDDGIFGVFGGGMWVCLFHVCTVHCNWRFGRLFLGNFYVGKNWREIITCTAFVVRLAEVVLRGASTQMPGAVVNIASWCGEVPGILHIFAPKRVLSKLVSFRQLHFPRGRKRQFLGARCWHETFRSRGWLDQRYHGLCLRLLGFQLGFCSHLQFLCFHVITLYWIWWEKLVFCSPLVVGVLFFSQLLGTMTFRWLTGVFLQAEHINQSSWP